MSVVIRFTRRGKKGERKFRLVVSEKRSRRDGRAIDTLGWYEKRVDKEVKNIDKDKYDLWIGKGALPTASVLKVMQK